MRGEFRMTIKEVFKKYEHLDYLLRDKDWLEGRITDIVLYDLWQAIRNVACQTTEGTPNRSDSGCCNGKESMVKTVEKLTEEVNLLQRKVKEMEDRFITVYTHE